MFQNFSTNQYKEAVRQWTNESQKQETKEETDIGGKWPYTMTLPCRNCSATHGLLPITSFTTARDYKEIWRVCISKGQFLTCFKCARSLGFTKGSSDAIVYCDGCHHMKEKRDFDKNMLAKWQHACADEDILCKECSGSADIETDEEALSYSRIALHITMLMLNLFEPCLMANVRELTCP